MTDTLTVGKLIWDSDSYLDDVRYVIHIPDVGRITVLDRLTGYGDGTVRDIETGFKDTNGKFWLASGRKDVRDYPELTIEEAVAWIKSNANNCVGD